MTKIILDCFGGDRGAVAAVGGAVEALNSLPDLHLILTGDSDIIAEELKKYKCDEKRLEIVHAPQVIGADEKPTVAIRAKKDSSMMRAIELLRADDGIAGMVSVGSTGALVSAGVLRIGRLRGVIRPAFCPVLPTMNGGLVGICDSGANVECGTEHLLQFAVMGDLYLKTAYGINKPRIALLNVGVEAEKGDELRKKTYELLAELPGIEFVGNMESRDLLSGKYDLVVCDGFSGNVLIKSTEGALLEMLKMLKKDISSGVANKIGAIFMRRMFMKEKEFLNYENYGGSILLGTKKIIVKGHGSSKAHGIAKCIEQAYKADNGNFCTLAESCLVNLPGAKI